ncbi:hypothetical protein, partial [Mesorhizobium sp.]|uniref:hypothetical protein n=1 Tax=Mesorhizobium sp. TaxID=1871066 RepID=UPI0025F2750F
PVPGERLIDRRPKVRRAFLLSGWNPIWRQSFGAATKRCVSDRGQQCGKCKHSPIKKNKT